MHNPFYEMSNLEKQLCAMESFDSIKYVLNDVELHPKQCIDVMKMLAKKRSILIYDTGTGKTLMVSAAMKLLWNEDPNRKFIMFVKKDQLIQTPKKIEDATGRKSLVSAADAKSISSVLSGDYTDYSILMLTHDCLRNERILQALYDVRDQYCGVIIDEAHEVSNFNHASSSSMLGAIVGNFEYCWALTATPITTNVNQLAKLASIVDKEHFSDFKKFQRYIDGNLEHVHEFPSFLIIRGRAEFGGKQEYRGRVHWVEPMPHQKIASRGAAAMLCKYKGEGAYNQANALIQEILSYKNKRGLVYVNQHQIRNWLLPFFENAGIVYECINGYTSADDRQRIMHQFNVEQSIDVVITSVTTAVDLDCDYVIFYEFTVDVKQMIGRAHRGLGNKVLDIIYVITDDSDEVDYFVNNIWSRCEMIRDTLGQDYSEMEDVERCVEERYVKN